MYLRPDKLEIRHCEECGTFFVSPAPHESVLSQFYMNYFSRHMDPICRQDKYILLRDPLDDFRVMQIASLLNPRGKKLLDIGFGKGGALVRFNKLGANVEGIEIDEDAIRFAKEELGIGNVGNFRLDQLETSKRYDIILMNDLIEHLLDPLSILTEARSRLNEGGLLSIWTPNASFVHSEKEPYLFRVDLQHLQFLTFKTCTHLAHKLDLQLTHLEGVGFSLVERIKRLSALNRNAALRKIAEEDKKRNFVKGGVKAIIRSLLGYKML
jgi:2-polyprenyl-3-methyl-5-hydroxy-6-metoxy-1,4-benzoquinol methylase